jgi:hypothetical protein
VEVKVSYCFCLLKVPKVFAADMITIGKMNKKKRMLLAVRVCLSIAPITTH